MERRVPASDEMPLIDPARPVLRLQPAKALYHFKRLIEDKERTEEVFPIFAALPWRGLRKAAAVFLSSERGRAIRAREPTLPPILDDHASLRRMPKDSLAHAYCDFMEREGLTAQGLVDEFTKFATAQPLYHDQLTWYLNRLRDTHDLQHILTGFGRDALGEQCVLAFTYGQQPTPANLFLGYAGAFEISRRVPSAAPVFRAVWEGQQIGKNCPRLAELPIRDLLPLPLDEVRKYLNIRPPRYYHEAHAAWRAIGIDPYNLWPSRLAEDVQIAPSSA